MDPLRPLLVLALLSVGCTGGAAPVAPQAPARAPGECALELWTGAEWTPRAAMSCGADGRIGVLLAGDVGWPGPVLDATLAAMRARCAPGPCDLGLLAGDLLYGDGADAEGRWRRVWDDGFAALGLPFAAVLGNHEWRHEPNSAQKRAAVFAADGRAGLLAPAPSYAARVRTPEGRTLLAIAGLDTDSVSNPAPHMPGIGADSLATACAQGAPVIWLGHHPASSEGLHHTHEAPVEAALRRLLRDAVGGGCRIAVAAAGHDHDQQAWGPGCEEPGMPGVVVSGVAARGFRPAGPRHLRPCPSAPTATASYHAGPRETGGFAHLSIDTRTGHTRVELIEATAGGSTLLSSVAWALP